MKSRWIIGVGLGAGLMACASNPHNVPADRIARVTGKRAIVHHDMRMREFVYFTQLNKLDLTDRWGDFPHKLAVPGGMNALMIVCEWYGELSSEAAFRSAVSLKYKFIAGHEYDVSSRIAEGGVCITTVTDLTAQERQAEAEPAATTKKSSTSTSRKTVKKVSKKKSSGRKSK